MKIFQTACLLVFVLTFAGFLFADENIGKVSQPLVGGTVTTADQQEVYTLLTLLNPGASCSASLIRNSWVITAAHCVETKDASGNTVVYPADKIRLTANWPKDKATGNILVQNRNGKRVFTFRPYDVAIIEVDPFTVKGDTTEHYRYIFHDDQFPYFGSVGGVPLIVFGRGINQFATGSGPTAKPSSSDGLFRVGFFRVYRDDGLRYAFPASNGQMGAGGDSGGPSFAIIQNAETALVGVHSQCQVECVEGQTCAEPNPWMWAKATPECSDAPIAPVLDQIDKIIGPFVSANKEPALEPPPPGFIGTFGTTPANLEPIWVYGMKPNGDLMWYRKDNNDAPWQGPKQVGNGWQNFVDVIPAGGNNFFALTSEGKLNWYQHQGFSDGTYEWKGPINVGSNWKFLKIFSGGEGIVYAIQSDGVLLWYKNYDYRNGIKSWTGPNTIGSGWQNFKHVFSTGMGTIFAVTQDGQVLRYQHKGYLDGSNSWSGPKTMGSGWDQYMDIIPVGSDVVFAIDYNGKMFWYRLPREGLSTGGGAFGAKIINFEGPVEVGTGWNGFKKVIGMMPAQVSVVR